MAENTKIEWADHTFNPWIGCQKVSPACDHCYAETLMDTRLGQVEWGPGKPRKRTSEANWRLPYKWNRQAEKAGKPARVFCASLADVFDNAAPQDWRSDLWQLIRETPYLTWMLLTKRAENIARMLPVSPEYLDIRERVWIGVTAENQDRWNRQTAHLRETHAAARFVSVEPLLERIDPYPALEDLRGHSIDWIIIGGESGANARPMHPEWARAFRDACKDTGTAFFMKQWGEWFPGIVEPSYDGPPWRRAYPDIEHDPTACDWEGRWSAHEFPDGEGMLRVGKKRAGRMLDGRTWDGMPA